MTFETKISDEETQLITEARNLGWSWAQIATIFRGRTAQQLKRIFGAPSKTRRSAAKKEDVRTVGGGRDRQEKGEKGEKRQDMQSKGAVTGGASGQPAGTPQTPQAKRPTDKEGAQKGHGTGKKGSLTDTASPLFIHSSEPSLK